jgi:hypothetical protein
MVQLQIHFFTWYLVVQKTVLSKVSRSELFRIRVIQEQVSRLAQFHLCPTHKLALDWMRSMGTQVWLLHLNGSSVSYWYFIFIIIIILLHENYRPPTSVRDMAPWGLLGKSRSKPSWPWYCRRSARGQHHSAGRATGQGLPAGNQRRVLPRADACIRYGDARWFT